MVADIDGFLPDRAFLLDVPATDWKDAIRLAGKGLVAAGFNDPVSLVIGLAGHDENEHITVMSAIASALINPKKTAALATAPTPEAIRDILHQ